MPIYARRSRLIIPIALLTSGYRQIWMVHPYIRPPNVMAEADASSAATAARQARVEYLATLSRHSAAVNVVRFSPNGM